MYWSTTRFRIDLSRPQVMGIVNVTPDSFSDGGQHADAMSALAHCEQLLAEGADILDIGGESTRPGSSTPTEAEELARVEPVLRHAVKLGVPVSVDTSSPLVIRTALDLGVDIINDVRSLQRPGALEALLASGVGAGVCVMHMQGEPATMQVAPVYGDVAAEVGAFLAERLTALRAHGVADERVVLDPGYGFGKTVAHNLELLQRQRELLVLGRPLLVGLSRKSCLGTVTGRPVDQRLVPSVAAVLAAVTQGARVVRVHDVAATVDAMRVWQAAGLAGSNSAH
ncbi:dihydropteroate synthase [Azohydromonas caseinilytica]|uniref:Dihydropteroate synthase n=1 Tax=Azohydromonas caseinilytica TaxID=2728836 RepID=A0A848FAQ2_9BURK|nr:dihydropteroate synthase [Azohydromonas caseinilytica]NML15403.1 dihydropteroate synthase [Azohydromonas caseinilytica]